MIYLDNRKVLNLVKKLVAIIRQMKRQYFIFAKV